MIKKVIYVDFDGVINSYKTKFSQEDPIYLPDPPVPGAIAWLCEAVKHFHVVIFTCRMLHGESEAALHAWFRDHGMPNHLIDQLAFSCVKRGASVYIDDRAINFSGVYPTMEFLENFKPWNKI